MTCKSEKIDIKDDAVPHAPEALRSILEIMRDPMHKDRLRAAQEVLNRAFGPVDKQSPPEARIAERFLNDELSATDAVLLIEAHGQKAPLQLKGIANSEDLRQRIRQKK